MKRYRVTLTPDEREQLTHLISSGTAVSARKLAHARVLLQVDESPLGPSQADEPLAAALNLSVRTLERVRQRFVEEGLDAALVPAVSKRVYKRSLDGAQEARLIALACSQPPDGTARWTLRLLAQQVVELQIAEQASHELVRRTLKKTS